ncbi:HSP20-like chaperone [Anaeromyces robustus]|uniref:HSP20-like chaperone n=1 Tax=Anaeromyces robustus TaxID=1754192 RepID=A0A1Y1XJW8_9FUNG|nr:HSP20-like chaperone [Anaeromyces robustus]|eukprot:ORX85993.1 HSP20-like chaperone [Anaeromyces robustus]
MPLFFPYRLFPELLIPNTIFDASDRFLEMEKPVRYDISENNKEYIIEMDVPGFSVEDIVIECEADGTLTIKSEQKKEEKENKKEDKKEENEKEKEKMNVIVKGRNYKSFQYSFKFPCLDKVEASFKNGVLTVKIEKIKKPNRQIAISKL